MTIAHRFLVPLLSITIMAFAACVPRALPTATVSQVTTTEAPRKMTIQPDNQPDAVSSADLLLVGTGLTYAQVDGSRLAFGQGGVPHVAPLDIPLDGTPVWVVAAPLDRSSVWVVALEDGRLQAFALEGRRVTPRPVEPSQLPPGMPPSLRVEESNVRIVAAPSDASILTHPVLVRGDGVRALLAYVANNGDFVLWDLQEGIERARFAIDALPDARILVDERARLLLLAGATTRYDHGVLGDALEASTVVLIETAPEPRVALTLAIPAPQVVEGLAPLWADMNGDGLREIIVTLSDQAQGARVVVYEETGMPLAIGPAIGQGNRWRHQLVVAPLGLTGEMELAEVLTPHIGGIVQFSRLEGDQLVAMARLTGYTSHMIGSRNLDMAAAGDFDGDGYIELLLPDNTFQTLGALRHTVDSAEVAWTVEIGGRLSTNLATTQLADGTLLVGVGRVDKALRIWPRQ